MGGTITIDVSACNVEFDGLRITDWSRVSATMACAERWRKSCWLQRGLRCQPHARSFGVAPAMVATVEANLVLPDVVVEGVGAEAVGAGA